MFKKILIAIDGSESATHAVEYAIQLAKEVDAVLEIVYVVRYAIGTIDAGILPTDIEANEKENAIDLINKIKAEYPNVKIDDFEAIGFPREQINKVIHEWHADLLIIGHHTHNFIEKLLIGSVENTLLHHLQIPLLVIPKNYKTEA